MCFWSYLSPLIAQTAHDWLWLFFVDTEAVSACHKAKLLEPIWHLEKDKLQEFAGTVPGGCGEVLC